MTMTAIQINTEADYQAVTMLEPLLVEIAFKDLKHHYFILSASDKRLVHATVPPTSPLIGDIAAIGVTILSITKR